MFRKSARNFIITRFFLVINRSNLEKIVLLFANQMKENEKRRIYTDDVPAFVGDGSKNYMGGPGGFIIQLIDADCRRRSHVWWPVRIQRSRVGRHPSFTQIFHLSGTCIRQSGWLIRLCFFGQRQQKRRATYMQLLLASVTCQSGV